MARDDAVPNGEGWWWLLANPWPSILVGLMAAVLAAILSSHQAPLLLTAVLAIALLAAGRGVVLRFQAMNWDLDERLQTAGALALAGLVSFIASTAATELFDSMALALRVLGGVALAGAALVLLPQGLRRAAISVLVLIHFGGILTAVISVPPPGKPAPWLTSQLWTRFYRPYLEMMYLNNAYHFYSPEPGPPTLLWFYIEYTDGSMRVIKIPNRNEFRTRLEYQRRLALTESTNQLEQVSPGILEVLAHDRHKAGLAHDPQIPLHPGLPATIQYRPPNAYSRLMVHLYARHVARAYPHETNPDAEVKSVKVYRLVHRIIDPTEMSMGLHPLDPETYLAYYQGEFDRDGNLLKPHDPFLYWLIPIYRDDTADLAFSRIGAAPEEQPNRYEREPRNYLDIHAGIKK